MVTTGNIWSRIDYVLEKRGMSLKGLAEVSGLNYLTIKTQRNKSDLTKISDAVAISKALGVSLDYLLTGKEAEAFSKEAIAVEYDDRLKALVRAVQRDEKVLSAISVIIQSYESAQDVNVAQ